VRIQAISDQQNIPKRFLEQILNELRCRRHSREQARPRWRLPSSNFLGANHTRQGHSPDRRAVAPVSCVSERYYERCSCPSEEKCGIRSIMKEVRDAIVRIPRGCHTRRTLRACETTAGVSRQSTRLRNLISSRYSCLKAIA
jgi:hypothetical protein